MSNSPNPLPSIRVISLTQPQPTDRPRCRSLSEGESTQPPPPTDLRWFRVEEFLNSTNLAANSRKLYARELQRFLGWTDLIWGEMTPRHLARYKRYLAEEVVTKQGGTLSKSSVNAAIAALKAFFSWFVQCHPEVMPEHPMVGIKFEKLPMPPVQSLSEAEMQRVWDVLEFCGVTQARDTVLIHLLSHGLRAGEVVDLNVGAFDGKLLFLADTKTNEPRLVPLRSAACQAVQEYLDDRQTAGEELLETRPLLLSHHHARQGERLSYHGIYYAIEKLGNWAELPDLHPHQFRHTYASELLAQGIDPMHAKRLTGHRSDQAFKRYVLRSEQEAAISAFYRAIGETNDGAGEEDRKE
jgi:integrase/recombinase XerD